MSEENTNILIENLCMSDYIKVTKEISSLEEEIERLKEEYMILQNASDEVEEEKDREIERLNKGINKIIQYINSLELGSDQEPYNKEGYAVSVYDIEKMLVDLIGSDKE